MPRVSHITVSMTETRQFRRLVRFITDVDSLARINADDELESLVDDCYDDLLSSGEESVE